LQELIESWKCYKIPHYLKNQGVEITSSKEKILSVLPKDKQLEIRNLAYKYFKSSNFIADYSWEWGQECSDWSDLYTLARFNWEICLVKIAAWEFNRQTFIDGWRRHTNFNKSPFPLFVVNQHDSYLAFPWNMAAEIRNIDARLYLDLYAVIASLKEWTADKFSSWEYADEVKQKFDWSQIKIPEYEELKSELSKTND
jgi:hypothetical protein